MGHGYQKFHIIACEETKLQADKTIKYLFFDKKNPANKSAFGPMQRPERRGTGVAFLVKESWRKAHHKKNKHKQMTGYFFRFWILWHSDQIK